MNRVIVILGMALVVLTADAQEWVARYNGPVNEEDQATAIAVDGSGNVYVTGWSFGVAASGKQDYVTIKYNSSGIEQWVARYNGPDDWTDEAYAIAVDNSGNVYVTGQSRSAQSDGDYLTIKYNSSGDTCWVRRYNGPGNYQDNAVAIAVDDAENVYVTGSDYGTGYASWDCATIKYNSSGTIKWCSRYNGNDYGDGASAIAVDTNGNVYITGSSCIRDYAPPFGDYVTIKYDSSGSAEWVNGYNGTGNYWDGATAIAVDDAGNVYVTGWSFGAGTNEDYATIKYSPSGDTVWIARYDGPGSGSDDTDIGTAIAVDNNGNVYVTGKSQAPGTYYDYCTIKYNSSGDTVWVRRYHGGHGTDCAVAIAVDESGNVYVTGTCADYAISSYVTIKYNSDGVEQ